ncbi:MAG: hypothetical protein IJT20_05530 [Synergistaceae bacterium]|nr:hypothetical protein [Synergistaceae bacterium]
MKKIFVCSAFLICACMPVNGAELVTQPAYSSMSFYVYKPSNVPNEFFATYDGYLVYRDEKGIWNYASNENKGITKTGYVVGSVIPSVVKLKPLNEKISSVAPILDTRQQINIKPVGTRRATPNENITLELNQPEVLRIDVSPITTRPAQETRKITPKPQPKPEVPQILEPKSSRLVYTPPSSGLEVYALVVYSPNASDWTQNTNFMAIGKWQKSVDRIGVLDKPKTPVAWKGDYPEVIYAWTGLQWRQMTSRGRHISALSTIRRENYALTVHTNKLNALSWGDDDTYVLSQYAVMWGYKWLGQILTGREY